MLIEVETTYDKFDKKNPFVNVVPFGKEASINVLAVNLNVSNEQEKLGLIKIEGVTEHLTVIRKLLEGEVKVNPEEYISCALGEKIDISSKWHSEKVRITLTADPSAPYRPPSSLQHA